jgi:phage terminase small subunit
MPVLKNPKHERFAQELAKGETAASAYLKAGYEADHKSAETAGPRLFRNVQVQGRVQELQERGAKRAEVTVASITERLIRIADKGEDLKEASGLSVARQAAMDAAKLHGLVVDKMEKGKPGDFSRMSEDELDAFITSRKAALGGSDSGERAADRQAGVRGKSSGLH